MNIQDAITNKIMNKIMGKVTKKIAAIRVFDDPNFFKKRERKVSPKAMAKDSEIDHKILSDFKRMLENKGRRSVSTNGLHQNMIGLSLKKMFNSDKFDDMDKRLFESFIEKVIKSMLSKDEPINDEEDETIDFFYGKSEQKRETEKNAGKIAEKIFNYIKQNDFDFSSASADIKQYLDDNEFWRKLSRFVTEDALFENLVLKSMSEVFDRMKNKGKMGPSYYSENSNKSNSHQIYNGVWPIEEGEDFDKIYEPLEIVNQKVIELTDEFYNANVPPFMEIQRKESRPKIVNQIRKGNEPYARIMLTGFCSISEYKKWLGTTNEKLEAIKNAKGGENIVFRIIINAQIDNDTRDEPYTWNVNGMVTVVNGRGEVDSGIRIDTYLMKEDKKAKTPEILYGGIEDRVNFVLNKVSSEYGKGKKIEAPEPVETPEPAKTPKPKTPKTKPTPKSKPGMSGEEAKNKLEELFSKNIQKR